MKRPILLIALLSLLMTFSGRMRAAEPIPTTDRIVLSDLTYDSDLEFYYFDVSLDGSLIYTAYNMDIFLPEGITSDKDYVQMMELGDEGIYPCTYNKIKKTYTYTHTLSASQPTANQLRVACTSSVNDEFTKVSGVLFRVYVELDNAALAASVSPKPIVTVSGIALVQKEDARKYVPADFSCQPFTTAVPADRTVSVNISSVNKVGTLILPFDAELPTGVQAYICNAVDNDGKTMLLTPVNSIEACKPYIVISETGYTGNFNGSVDLGEDYADDGVYTQGLLTGVLKPTVINSGYVLQNQGAGPKFYSAEGESFTIPAGRCYLTPSGALSVKVFDMKIDEASEIKQVSEDATSDVYYDFSGRRVERLEKGLYIKGTQKVFVK